MNNIIKNAKTVQSAQNVRKITQEHGNFGCWGGIRGFGLGVDDDGTIHGGSQPMNMGMPKECSTLAQYRELVSVRLPASQWALGDVSWSIRPICQPLVDPMPVIKLPEINLISIIVDG